MLMQALSSVKLVPRVLFELDQAGLMQLLSTPNDVSDLLVSLCKQHGFDGLVRSPCLYCFYVIGLSWSYNMSCSSC